jgi:hypothetical protein
MADSTHTAAGLDEAAATSPRGGRCNGEVPTSGLPGGRLVAWVLVVIVAVVSIAETAATLLLAGPEVSEEDWQAAAEHVRARFRKGDLIVFRPDWQGPLGRMYMGDLLDLEQVSRPDDSGYERIWVVGSGDGRTQPTTEQAKLEEKGRWEIGALNVRLWKQNPPQVAFDFYEHLAEATVSVVGADGKPAYVCPYRERRKRHQCKAGWNNVRKKLAEVGYRLRRCIHAHPIEHGALKIHYSDVPVGSRLVVYTGLDGYDARFRAKNALYQAKRKGKEGRNIPTRLVGVKLTVEVGGERIGAVTHPIDEGWHRFVMEMGRHAEKTSDLSFLIETRWSYSKTFCFYAQTRK